MSELLLIAGIVAAGAVFFLGVLLGTVVQEHLMQRREARLARRRRELDEGHGPREPRSRPPYTQPPT